MVGDGAYQGITANRSTPPGFHIYGDDRGEHGSEELSLSKIFSLVDNMMGSISGVCSGDTQHMKPSKYLPKSSLEHPDIVDYLKCVDG